MDFQAQIANPHIEAEDIVNPRKRQRTACDRCKARKQRCDNAYPQCSNCAKSAAQCSRPPEWEGQHHAYTRALEDQIAFLENKLSALENQQQVRPELVALNDSPCGVRRDSTLEHGHQMNAVTSPGLSTPGTQNNVADVVGLLSLGNGNTEAASYIGSSSGYALATDLGKMVQATVWNKTLWVPRHDENESRSRNTGKVTLKDLHTERAEPPPDDLAERLINAYLSRIHPRFPFLYRSDIWEAHRIRFSLGQRLQAQSPRTADSFASPAYRVDGFALFVLYMVYAIGALNLRLTEDYVGTSPEQLYVFAMQYVKSVREASPIHNLEATVLLILYHLRSESRNGLWHLTGLAMRTVTDIGLHRAASTVNLSPFEAQLRRRLFWSVYALESIMTSTLGRPISLSDCDIDQPLPRSVDDGDLLNYQPELNPIPTHICGQQAYPPTNLSQFILLSQLHIFEARIQRTVYRVDRSITALEPKMQRLLSDLEQWRDSIPTTLHPVDHDRIMLHYHRAVRLLLQPFLAHVEPESEIFKKCIIAAGQICQVHKRFHQTPEYGHSFVAVHTVFVSGITLLYTLGRGKDKVWSFSISNDIRAASSVLCIMGERAAWIRRFRDTFDGMVEATMASLQNPDRDSSDCTGDPAGDNSNIYHFDFAIFDDLNVTDTGALEMAKEMADWISY